MGGILLQIIIRIPNKEDPTFYYIYRYFGPFGNTVDGLGFTVDFGLYSSASVGCLIHCFLQIALVWAAGGSRLIMILSGPRMNCSSLQYKPLSAYPRLCIPLRATLRGPF